MRVGVSSTWKNTSWLQMGFYCETQSKWIIFKRYTQTYGVDYQETFTLVAKMNSIRVLLSCIANFDWDLQQFDVKNAFLHRDLEKEVYVEIFSGCPRETI